MRCLSAAGLTGGMRKLWLSASSLWLVLMLSACEQAPAVADPTLTVRILHTSDIHGKLTGYNYFSARNDGQPGLVHAAAAIAAARAEQANVILIDNGDLIQGDPFADWSMELSQHATHPIIAALNSLNYDVANLGNHEFNYGLEKLYQAYRGAEFPLLSSNVRIAEGVSPQLTATLQSWVLLPRQFVASDGSIQAIKIAVIGVVPPQIMQWDANLLTDKLLVRDMVEATAEAAAAARQAGADLIIVAAHTGLPRTHTEQPSTEQVVDQIAQLAQVDAIVFGHQHLVFPGNNSYSYHPSVDEQRGTIHGVPAVSPGYAGSHVGQIDLTLQRHGEQWRVVQFAVQVRPSDVEQLDSALLAQLQDAHLGTQQFVRQPVGVSQQLLSYAEARIAPSSGVQFVQRAQQWYAEQRMEFSAAEQQLPLLSAAAPFDAAADSDEAFTEIAAGKVSLGQIADLYRYPNSLDVVKLTGLQLRDWLEASAAAFVSDGEPENPWSWVNRSVPHYNFDSILGLEYSIDPRQPLGQRIVNLRYQGQPLSHQQQFLVLLNSYRASGGGGMPHLDGSTIVRQSPDQLPDILRWYISSFGEQGYHHAIDPHWFLCQANQCDIQ